MKAPTYVVLATLLALVLALASGLASYALPLGRGADEEDHLDYLLFLAHEKRLPDPRDEAVGQIQHPPLAYAGLGALWRLATSLDEDAGPHDDASAPLERRGTRILGRVTSYDPQWRRIDDLGLKLEEARGLEVPPKTRALYLARRSVFQWLRLAAVLLGFGTFLLVALALREVWPDRPGLTLATTALLTLTAQAAVGFATISNDPLSAFLGALAAYLGLRARRREQLAHYRPLILTSLVLGLAFLTKLHAVGVAAFLAFIVLGAPIPLSQRLRSLGILVAGPLLIAGWWHFRQWQLLGSPLALQHHLDFQPALIRLGDWRPTTLLDYLNDLGFSFFGRFGQEKVATHPLAVWPALSLVLIGLAGLLTSRPAPKRARGSADEDTASRNAPLAAPTRAAALALCLLVALIAYANRHYYHVHGRYLLAVLVPLGIAVAGGWDRLIGRRAEGLLGLGAVLGTVATGLTLVFVLLPRYSVPGDDVDRGRVHRFIDAGNPMFDQLDAGGNLWVAPGGRVLSNGRDTYRWAPQLLPEPEIRYRFDGLDPQRRYQIRLTYPRPDGAAEGDLPAPSAIALIGDSWALHRSHALWPELGPIRVEIPHPVSQDGQLDIWWQNAHPAVNSVGVSRIWIEEAWLGLDDPPRLVGRDVLLTLRNLDEKKSHGVVVLVEHGPDLLLRWPQDVADREVVAAGDQRVLRLPLPEDAPQNNLRVRIVDTDVSPQVSLKLAHWRRDGIATGATLASPDLVTLRATPSAEDDLALAEILARRLLPGPHRLEITFPAGALGDDDPRLQVNASTSKGKEIPLLRVAGILPSPHAGTNMEMIAFELEVEGSDPVDLKVTLTSPAGSGETFDLDRIILKRLPEHDKAGHGWDVRRD